MLLYEFIIVVFETYIYMSFLGFFIKKTISRKWLYAIYAILMFGMISYRVLIVYHVLWFFTLSTGSVVIFTMLCGMRLKRALILGGSVSVANMIAQEFSCHLMAITYNQTFFGIGKETDLYLTGAMVSKLILFTFMRLLIRICYKHDRRLPKLQWYATMAVPLISIYTAHQIPSITERFRSADGIYSYVFLGGLAAINMLSFLLYDELAKQSKTLIEKEQENIRLEAENSKYSKIIAYLDETHSFMHDIKGHLKNILSLTESAEYNEAANYIRKLDIEVTEMYDNHILPQYPSVDTVLRQKTNDAKKHGIKLEHNITVPIGIPIEQIDLCIILGNALDNAIEACAKLERDLSINLEMFVSKNRLIINLTNPSTPLEIDGNKCTTTKEDDSAKHGYGLGNISKTLEKYNGNMLIRYNDGYFCMIALILF